MGAIQATRQVNEVCCNSRLAREFRESCRISVLSLSKDQVKRRVGGPRMNRRAQREVGYRERCFRPFSGAFEYSQLVLMADYQAFID